MGIDFGNYGNLHINQSKSAIDYLHVPTELNEYSFLIAQKYAIAFRDEMLVANLKNLGVATLLDIGCDFGSLIHSASNHGILARGVDVSDSAINLAKMANLDVVKYSIDQLIVDRSFQNVALPQKRGFSAVSCLNILHGKWEDSSKRDEFLDICLSNYDYVAITVTRELLSYFQKMFGLKYVQFIGPGNRPIRNVSSQLTQYGTTFFFNGRMHLVECHFWRLLLGSRRFPNPIDNYLRLTAIVSTQTRTMQKRRFEIHSISSRSTPPQS